MMLSRKTKGLFVDWNEYSTIVAVASATDAPLTVEAVKELPAGPNAPVADAIDELLAGGKRGGLRHAVCGIYPARRLIRRASLDPKKVREPNYFSELISSQFRVEPNEYALRMIGAANGDELDPANPAAKDVLFCGSHQEDFRDTQRALLATGIYPERMELSTVATLGSVRGLLSTGDNKAPTLVLELGKDATTCFIINNGSVDLARPIPHGVNSMIPVVQKELGLKDEEAAGRLLFSNTFDFTGMGPTLVKRLLKELQSSIGFYEVQTGQSIGQLVCTVLPSSLAWMGNTLATSLGITQYKPDVAAWLDRAGVRFAPDLPVEKAGAEWFGLVSLMAQHGAQEVGS